MSYLTLEKCQWSKIPNSGLILKYNIHNDGYIILVTDLKNIFGENVDEEEIQEKFSSNNPHVKMKTNVILKHLKNTLENSIAEKESNISIEIMEVKVKIHLEFQVNQISLVFNLEPCILPSTQLYSHIIFPTLTHALFTYQEKEALKKKVADLEKKLRITSTSQSSVLLDPKLNLKAFNLFDNINPPGTLVVDSFLEMQDNFNECHQERENIVNLHKGYKEKLVCPSPAKSLSVKRELPDPVFDIKYEEPEIKNSVEDGAEMVAALPQITKLKKKKKPKVLNVYINCMVFIKEYLYFM